MIRDAIDAVTSAIIKEKDYLNMLDEKTGDGDHGTNMARGVAAVNEALDELESTENLKEVLQTIGEAVALNVGGSAGPLYGAGILEAAKAVDENDTLTAETLEKVFGAIVEEIKKRGHSDSGDKTMLDVLIPIYETFKPERVRGKTFDEILIRAGNAARDGLAYTKTLNPKKGRTGDPGENFEDPGAASAAIIFRALSGYWKEEMI